MAPRVGLEPTTTRLTAEGSAIELPRNGIAWRRNFDAAITRKMKYYHKTKCNARKILAFSNNMQIARQMFAKNAICNTKRLQNCVCKSECGVRHNKTQQNKRWQNKLQ